MSERASLLGAVDNARADTPATLTQVARDITEFWHLQDADVRAILGHSKVTLRRLARRKALDEELVQRIKTLAAIYVALHRLFGDNEELADGWIHRPNRAFGDEPPIVRLRLGSFEELEHVRRYVQGAANA